MYLTEKEIFSQYKALKQTFNYFMEKKDDIRRFKEKYCFKGITYIGSGSGACLCESAEVSAKVYMDMSANSLTAGDLMLNFSHYSNLLKDSLIVTPSRSGSTTEVIKAIEKAKESHKTLAISISAKKDSVLGKICDLSLELPWAFDESVCQTRTVTNLYMANLILIAIFSGNDKLIDEIKQSIEKGEMFIEKYSHMLEEIGKDDWWDRVVVLGDSELQGIASEAAIAFMEIPQIQANFHHILDVRHGPIVLINDKTLVVMACSNYGISLQKDLIKDIQKKGAKIITIGSSEGLGSDYHVNIPDYCNYGVKGIPFIFVPQVIAYNKAKLKGINPDLPDGLESYIEL